MSDATPPLTDSRDLKIAEQAETIAQLRGEIAQLIEQNKRLQERIERLEEERTGITTDIGEVFAEAKGEGFDVKAMKQIIKIRKMDKADRQEAEYLLETYMQNQPSLTKTVQSLASQRGACLTMV